VHIKLIILALLLCSSAESSSPEATGRVAAGNGLGTGLRTMIKYVRRTASGVAGNGLGTTVKYLRRTASGTAGNGLGTTIKYL
jgi:hypothetical protein